MDIVDPRIESYLRSLQVRHDDPVLLAMEAEGERRGFPIVGRTVGVTLEVLARSVGARRVFELGSGFGYSAFWFARAVGPDGEVHCTDGDPANAEAGRAYLRDAGFAERVTYHVGDAVTMLAGVGGTFDVVYDDIDKHGYPQAWRAARDRIRPGGLYLCDNVLWAGRVPDDGEPADDVTDAIREHNAEIAADDRFLCSIVPIRDGVMVALRLG
jgi:predicted O-methyltransferase YrrM